MPPNGNAQAIERGGCFVDLYTALSVDTTGITQAEFPVAGAKAFPQMAYRTKGKWIHRYTASSRAWHPSWLTIARTRHGKHAATSVRAIQRYFHITATGCIRYGQCDFDKLNGVDAAAVQGQGGADFGAVIRNGQVG